MMRLVAHIQTKQLAKYRRICSFFYFICLTFDSAKSSLLLRGLLSSCDALAFHCSGLSYWGAWAIGHGLQKLWPMGVVALN